MRAEANRSSYTWSLSSLAALTRFRLQKLLHAEMGEAGVLVPGEGLVGIHQAACHCSHARQRTGLPHTSFWTKVLLDQLTKLMSPGTR